MGRFRHLAAMAALLAVATSANAQDEQGCANGRTKAAGKYVACQARSKIVLSLFVAQKCRSRYAATASRLQLRYPGTACDVPRLVDNLDGTITDNLTGLIWEKKDASDGIENLANPHDVDNIYTWSSNDSDNTDEDGTAFTDFLENLNSGAGFAGANGWRLPTLEELQTILSPDYPCMTCLDPAFGPTASYYWTSSTQAQFANNAWTVVFAPGGSFGFVSKVGTRGVRAVRGGLSGIHERVRDKPEAASAAAAVRCTPGPS